MDTPVPSNHRENIILSQGVLDRVERQTIGFAHHSERLKAVGRHIKRGLLLYGPPGTGKTLTAMYLANQMPGRTILLLTGRTVELLEQSYKMARLLQPATMILEDVDLIKASYRDNYERLAAIKAKYDPTNFSRILSSTAPGDPS